MKKLILIPVLVFFAIASYAQKCEILYFKANLPCCHARACNNLEADVKSIIDTKFKDGNVTMKVVKLGDEENKELVEKYNAKSQTVVLVSTKKKNETVVDVSDIVRNYARNNNKDEFETALIAKINELK